MQREVQALGPVQLPWEEAQPYIWTGTEQHSRTDPLETRALLEPFVSQLENWSVENATFTQMVPSRDHEFCFCSNSTIASPNSPGGGTASIKPRATDPVALGLELALGRAPHPVPLSVGSVRWPEEACSAGGLGLPRLSAPLLRKP